MFLFTLIFLTLIAYAYLSIRYWHFRIPLQPVEQNEITISQTKHWKNEFLLKYFEPSPYICTECSTETIDQLSKSASFRWDYVKGSVLQSSTDFKNESFFANEDRKGIAWTVYIQETDGNDTKTNFTTVRIYYRKTGYTDVLLRPGHAVFIPKKILKWELLGRNPDDVEEKGKDVVDYTPNEKEEFTTEKRTSSINGMIMNMGEDKDILTTVTKDILTATNNKSDLISIINAISKEFLTAKNVMDEEPEEATYILEKLLVQLTMLRSITFSSKQDEWLTEIERLHRLCTEKISLIQMRKRVENQSQIVNISNTTGTFTNIPNWKDPLLLQPFQIVLAETIILPYLFPHLYPVLKSIILLNGPSKSGKTFTLKAIESYLQVETTLNVLWKNVSSFQLSSVATVLQTAMHSLETSDMKIVVVIDRVTTSQWNTWLKEDWFQILLDLFKSNKSWKLVVVMEASGNSPDSLPQFLSWRPIIQTVDFKLPDVKTVYAYIKSLVSVYLDTRILSVPILLDLQGLVLCAETMVKFFHADFDKIESWIQRAVHLSHELVIEDAVVLKIGDHWIPKLSLFTERTSELPYTVCRGLMLSKNSVSMASLLRPIDVDAIVFDGDTYVNEKLLDYLPSVDPDRGMELFVKADRNNEDGSKSDHCSFMPSSSSSELEIICRFSVTLDRYPDIPLIMTHGIFSYLLASWISMWKNFLNTSMKTSSKKRGGDIQSKLAIVEPELQTIFYARDINTLLDETIDILVSGSMGFPESLTENNTHQSSKQVLILSGVDENFEFHFMYGQKSSKTFPVHSGQEGGGREGRSVVGTKNTFQQTFATGKQKGGNNDSVLPMYTEGGTAKGNHSSKGMLHGKEKAEEIKDVLDDLLGQKDSCQIFQIKTESGYEWFIDFFVALENPIEVKVVKGKAVRATLLPQIQSILVFDDLVQDYSITNEIDLDILQEKFPSMYRECFRDEEDTWKMMKLKDPSHLVTLNSFYTREHKFYLNLLFHLQCYKRDHYADLKIQQQPYLDHILTYVQNMVDFMLMITSENDENGTWEGIWSVSRNHMTYKNEKASLSRGSIDVSREWLKTDMTFCISPCLYQLLLDLCKVSMDDERDDVSTQLKSIFNVWKVTQLDREVLKETHRFYVKGKISTQTWKESKTTFHLLPNNETEISNKLKSKDYVLYYAQRLKQSLFHRLFENAQLIGCEENGGCGNVSWYSFGENKQNQVTKDIRTTIENIKSFENAWYLLSSGSKSLATSQLLFSLYFLSDLTNHSLIKQVVGSLLYFPILHVFSRNGQEKAVDSINQRTVLNVLNRKVSFLLKILNPSKVTVANDSLSGDSLVNDKFLFKEKEDAHSFLLHTSSQLTKNIFPSHEFENIKNYSLKVYHLMDQLYTDIGDEKVI